MPLPTTGALENDVLYSQAAETRLRLTPHPRGGGGGGGGNFLYMA